VSLIRILVGVRLLANDRTSGSRFNIDCVVLDSSLAQEDHTASSKRGELGAGRQYGDQVEMVVLTDRQIRGFCCSNGDQLCMPC